MALRVVPSLVGLVLVLSLPAVLATNFHAKEDTSPPPECKNYTTGPEQNLIRLSSWFGTTPYTILKFNPGKLPSNNPFEILPVGIYLQICSENDGRFGKEPGCLQKWPRPCSGYKHKEQEDCYCSYHEDNFYKYPFTHTCHTYIKCEGYKSKGQGMCTHHKIADDLNIGAFYGYLKDSELLKPSHKRKMHTMLHPDICVNKPEAWNGCNPESCTFVHCFGYEFLLPEGAYANPFDNSYRTAFDVDKNSLWKADLQCDDFMTWNKDKGECVPAKSRGQQGVCLADDQKSSVYNMEQVALSVIAIAPQGPVNMRPASRRLHQQPQQAPVVTNAVNPRATSSGIGGATNVVSARQGGCVPPAGGSGVAPCTGTARSRRRRALQSVSSLHHEPAFYAFWLYGQPLTAVTKDDLNPQSKHEWLKMVADGKLGR